MATHVLHGTVPLLRKQWRWPAVAFGACVAIGLGNDLLFAAVRGSPAIYLIDYALKALMLFLAWQTFRSLPTPSALRLGWPRLSCWLIALGAAGIFAERLAFLVGDAWRLFEWPALSWVLFRGLDLTIGLLLNAVAEEFVYRRLAFAVLPLGPRGKLVISSVLFGLIHWGTGLGSMLAAMICGLCWGYAYQRTGSLALVITAHYIVDVALFW